MLRDTSGKKLKSLQALGSVPEAGAKATGMREAPDNSESSVEGGVEDGPGAGGCQRDDFAVAAGAIWGTMRCP